MDLNDLQLRLLDEFSGCVPDAPGRAIAVPVMCNYTVVEQKAFLSLLSLGLVDVRDGSAKASLKGEQVLRSEAVRERLREVKRSLQ